MTKPGLNSRLLAVCVLLAAFSQQVPAQSLPQTDVWLASMHMQLPGVAVKINPTTGYNKF